MATERRTFFISAPAVDAYRKWKSFWGLLPAPETAIDMAEFESELIEDVPDQGVRWSTRWGPARIDGTADFIPAQGGCVLYLGLSGIGAMSKLVLSSPLERHFWGMVDKFRPVAEGLRGD